MPSDDSTVPFEKVRLTGVHLVFLIAMTLGFEVIVQEIYKYCRPYLGLSDDVKYRAGLLYFLPISAVVLLGFRFLWATVNIKRYIDRCGALIGREIDPVRGAHLRRQYERLILLFHAPVLILHGFLYYAGANLVSSMLFEKAPEMAIRAFIGFYVGYQILNVLWLLSLTKEFKPETGIVVERESIWIKNNVATSIIALVILVCTWTVGLNLQVAMVLVCVVFFVGSGVDLGFTTYHYLENPDSD